MSGLPSAKSAPLLDQDAFAPRSPDFATWSDDRPALKLPPQHEEAGHALIKAPALISLCRGGGWIAGLRRPATLATNSTA